MCNVGGRIDRQLMQCAHRRRDRIDRQIASWRDFLPPLMIVEGKWGHRRYPSMEINGAGIECSRVRMHWNRDALWRRRITPLPSENPLTIEFLRSIISVSNGTGSLALAWAPGGRWASE